MVKIELERDVLVIGVGSIFAVAGLTDTARGAILDLHSKCGVYVDGVLYVAGDSVVGLIEAITEAGFRTLSIV